MIQTIAMITALWVPMNITPGLHPTASDLKPFKIVVAHLSQFPKVKPVGQKWYVYIKGTRSYGGTLPATWYLKDKTGTRVKDRTYNSFVMNPANQGWRQYVLDNCNMVRALSKIDACYVDGMGTSSRTRVKSLPIDPTTHSTYTEADWMEAIGGIARILPDSTIINSAGNGRHFYETSQALSDPGIRISAEQFCDLLNSKTDQFTANVKMLHNESVMAIGKSWKPFKACLLTFLIGRTKEDMLFCAGQPVTGIKAVLRKRLGKSRGDYRVSPKGIYYRRYNFGTVVFNPTDTTINGSFSKPVHLRPHNGTILWN